MKKVKRSFSSNINNKNNIKKTKLNYNIDKNCLLNIKAQIINSKLVHGTGYNSDYVEYWIEVITDYKKWIVKKRYSEFYELNKVIMQKIPEINKLFPPKRFFKNSEDTIEERKTYFNKYLRFLFKEKNIFSFNEVLDFIQIEKKIVELYIKKHTMIKQDEDNYVFQSLKKSFSRMSFIEKMEKSKSVGQSLNRISSISTKINSKEDLIHKNDQNMNNIINTSIIESSDATYEIEELNSNYYSSLLEYEKIKNIQESSKNDKNNNNSLSNFKKDEATIVIEEFLKNLSQDIDNKTDILKTFEEFLKKGNKWPHFSTSDLIKLFTGNNNKSTINPDKKWSFCANNININQKSLNGNGINNINNINNIENEKRLSSKKKSLTNLEKNKNLINKDLDDSDYENENIILKGLFFYIGDFDNNILLSFGCLDLLVKLLDNEFNPEVEIYLRIFKTRRLIDYQSMRLNEIIKKNIGGIKATQNALKLLSILMEERNSEMFKKTLIKDENVYKQLEIYMSQIYD